MKSAGRRYLSVLTVLYLALSMTVSAGEPEHDGNASTTAAAIVNGHVITQRTLDEAVAGKLFALEQQKYAIRQAALDGLIADVILEQEAKKRNVSVDQFRTSLTQSPVTVSRAEVEERYAAYSDSFGSISETEAKERIRLDLIARQQMQVFRDKLSELQKNAAVTIALEPPRVPLPSRDHAPALGSDVAPVTVTIFSDFECEYCRAAHGPVRRLLNEYPEKVRLIFRHMPLNHHKAARDAALAATCAQRQGSFWEFSDFLFGAEKVSASTVAEAVEVLGIDKAAFEQCMNTKEPAATVAADLRLANLAGLTATPSFLVNGRRVPDSDMESLRRAVHEELGLGEAASTKPAFPGGQRAEQLPVNERK